MEIVNYIIATDQQLITLATDGDTVAFEYLFNRYRDALHRLYLQKTGGKESDVEDLLQEIFIKVYFNLNRYNESYTFGQWVYTIARNAFIDYTRRKRFEEVSIDHFSGDSFKWDSASSNPSPEESIIRSQQHAQLDCLMQKLKPRYREIIEMRFFKEYSYEEIGKALDLPIGTVKTQIHRAREALCKLITESPDF